MTAVVNPYFKKNDPLEQNLIESLIIESIQVLGQKYYYLSSTIQREDLILGEDIISKFRFALEIEMYQEYQQGWDNNNNILSKFGLQIQNEINFILSKSAWDAEIESYADMSTMKTGGIRPQEGDLIYEPVTKSLLEIKFVKDTNSDFFQLGRVYQYQLQCEFFSYESEDIDTGITDIDSFNINTFDLLVNQILSETGDSLIQESCGSLLLDIVNTPTTMDRKYGSDFSDESVEIGFDVTNPFGELA